jgi:hypothetical protein
MDIVHVAAEGAAVPVESFNPLEVSHIRIPRLYNTFIRRENVVADIRIHAVLHPQTHDLIRRAIQHTFLATVATEKQGKIQGILGSGIEIF